MCIGIGEAGRTVKPEKKTLVVERWDCGIANHNHLTERVAAACIEKRAGRPKRQRLSEDESKRRNIQVARKWASGSTFKDSGESIGVSGERCRSIIAGILRISRQLDLVSQPEPEYSNFRGIRNPEDMDHYMMMINSVAKYWGL